MPDADHTIELRDSSDFQPRGTPIRSGETVEWVNEGTVTHTVTAKGSTVPDDAAYFASGGFDSETAAIDGWEENMSGGLDPGETYRHTFETRGLYTYYSIPYEEDVSGQVEVGNPSTEEN